MLGQVGKWIVFLFLLLLPIEAVGVGALAAEGLARHFPFLGAVAYSAVLLLVLLLFVGLPYLLYGFATAGPAIPDGAPEMISYSLFLALVGAPILGVMFGLWSHATDSAWNWFGGASLSGPGWIAYGIAQMVDAMTFGFLDVFGLEPAVSPTSIASKAVVFTFGVFCDVIVLEAVFFFYKVVKHVHFSSRAKRV